ncbi:MAG TPA: response regulator transcription factor [Rhizomicrobium sp.]|jgi:DNA-binding NarL/FixJ family response regulator|nr:response regulator transcription factor [Rhizomicrobium sp.]
MTSTATKAKVFLVDDHPLVREMLKSLIEQQPDMTACGEAEDAAKALKGIAADKPHVAIIDLSLKESSGLELIKQIKHRHPLVSQIVLSMHDEKLYAERAIRAGARGYVMKRESTKQIVAAIRAVRGGKLWLSETVSDAFAQRFVAAQPQAGSSLESLSDRELEVFNLLGKGLPTRQVAQSLNVSIKTVQAYCARIKQKLQLSSATELLREAMHWHESVG